MLSFFGDLLYFVSNASGKSKNKVNASMISLVMCRVWCGRNIYWKKQDSSWGCILRVLGQAAQNVRLNIQGFIDSGHFFGIWDLVTWQGPQVTSKVAMKCIFKAWKCGQNLVKWEYWVAPVDRRGSNRLWKGGLFDEGCWEARRQLDGYAAQRT